MWVTMTTDYATRVVLALSLATGDRPLTRDELARRTQAPPTMLDQVLPVLRRDGVVRSQRGRYGGYRLNHDPATITLERVVRLFEGQLAPIECATRSNPGVCPVEDGCTMQGVWEVVRDRVIAELAAVTFADLAADAGGVWRDHRGLLLT